MPSSSSKKPGNHFTSGINVVSAYHNLSYKKLCNFDLEIEGDVVVCSDHSDAKQVVMNLTREIHSIRPLDGGLLNQYFAYCGLGQEPNSKELLQCSFQQISIA